MTQYGVEVACHVHGPVRYNAERGGWHCQGWDGEGCDRWLSAAAMFTLARGGGPVPVEFTPLSWMHDHEGALIKVLLGACELS